MRGWYGGEHQNRLTKCCLGDQVKENKMGEACGTYGGEDKIVLGFGGESEGKSHLEDLDVGGGAVLK